MMDKILTSPVRYVESAAAVVCGILLEITGPHRKTSSPTSSFSRPRRKIRTPPQRREMMVDLVRAYQQMKGFRREIAGIL
jgi:hypothetical protein